MEGGLGPALGFGSLSRKGSVSLVKLGSQGPRPGPPQGSEPTGTVGEACCFWGTCWDFSGRSERWELGPRRERDRTLSQAYPEQVHCREQMLHRLQSGPRWGQKPRLSTQDHCGTRTSQAGGSALSEWPRLSAMVSGEPVPSRSPQGEFLASAAQNSMKFKT